MYINMRQGKLTNKSVREVLIEVIARSKQQGVKCSSLNKPECENVSHNFAD